MSLHSVRLQCKPDPAVVNDACLPNTNGNAAWRICACSRLSLRHFEKAGKALNADQDTGRLHVSKQSSVGLLATNEMMKVMGATTKASQRAL